LIYFRTQQILFFIEMTYISQYYYNWKQVEIAKNQVLEISDLKINLTGKKNNIFYIFQRNYFLN